MRLQRPAVVLSGHTMALAVVRALGERGIPVIVAHYDPRDIAHTSKYAVDSIAVPDPMDDETAFVEALLGAGKRLRGGVMFPCSDESVAAISRNKARLEDRFVVACPEWDIVQRYVDKPLTYELAGAKGVPCPVTLHPSPADALGPYAQVLGFPLLVKPAQSHLFFQRFRRKMVRADTLEELENACHAAWHEHLEVMLQEIVPGDDSTVVNYNAYFHQGQPFAEFTARQLRKAPPFYGSPRVVRSEKIPGVVEPGRETLRALDFYGFANIEFKFDARDGTYKLIEVNGRPNLSGLLAVRCGINFPLIHYEHLTRGTLPGHSDYATGVYWTDLFRDAAYSLLYAGRERWGPQDYVRPYLRPRCDAIVDRRDPGPVNARLGYLLKNLRSAAGGAAIGRSRSALS
jgi:D-aspartate ligase